MTGEYCSHVYHHRKLCITSEIEVNFLRFAINDVYDMYGFSVAIKICLDKMSMKYFILKETEIPLLHITQILDQRSIDFLMKGITKIRNPLF